MAKSLIRKGFQEKSLVARILIDTSRLFEDKYKYEPARRTCVWPLNLELPDPMIASVANSKLLRLRRLKWLTSGVLRAE